MATNKKTQSFGILNYRRGEEIPRKFDSSSSVDENENILNEIYAPDPNTGFPRSDISVILSRSTDPVVKEFVAKVIMSPNNSSNYGDNSDVALELVPQLGETEDMYIDRLKDIIKSVENE